MEKSSMNQAPWALKKWYQWLKQWGLKTPQWEETVWKERRARILKWKNKWEDCSLDALKAICQEHRKQCEKEPESQELQEKSVALIQAVSGQVLGLWHFEEQWRGGLALLQGQLAEMKTGEGKSLCLTLAAAHQAWTGMQVHVVTVNDYLAKRDAQSMGPLYEALGLTVGWIQEGQTLEERRQQYACDIVYGVNHEFGFDFLRHHMAKTPEEQRLIRGLGFAIVDEVDSILIDEARTPLIMSTSAEEDLSRYQTMSAWVKTLPEDWVELDKPHKNVLLKEKGFEALEQEGIQAGWLEKGHHLYEEGESLWMKALQACLMARFFFHRDQHYILQEGKVIIVDEHTGRLMPDRRWNDGIHQAIEAKEGVTIQQENETQATITYQHFFKLYKKLSGLTGTAWTEQEEFMTMYGLEVVQIPTHKPVQRKDLPDVVFRYAKDKWDFLVNEVKTAHEKGQPVLIGTPTIEESEILAQLLNDQGLSFQLLNAKNHEKEALIIEEAGRWGAITLATNMAGRGTDIELGGHWMRWKANHPNVEESVLKEEWLKEKQKVIEAGGLFVLGAARNESLRVDLQLRGRSGRQGDPGVTRFCVSLEDALMKIYAQSNFLQTIDRFNMIPKGVAVEHAGINKALERAQRKVESVHYDMRKQLKQYDQVGSHQREMMYQWREALLKASDQELWAYVEGFFKEALEDLKALNVKKDFSLIEEWETESFRAQLKEFGDWWGSQTLVLKDETCGREVEEKIIKEWVLNLKKEVYGTFEPEMKKAMLEVLDEAWRFHLTHLKKLMESVHLRALSQKDPQQEYKKEAYEMFKAMHRGIIKTMAIRLNQWAKALKELRLMEQEIQKQEQWLQETTAQEREITDENEKVLT